MTPELCGKRIGAEKNSPNRATRIVFLVIEPSSLTELNAPYAETETVPRDTRELDNSARFFFSNTPEYIIEYSYKGAPTMSNFPQPLGSLPSGGRPRVFNPSILRRTDDSSTEAQYAKATTEEERKAIFHKAVAECEREKAIARMNIC